MSDVPSSFRAGKIGKILRMSGVGESHADFLPELENLPEN
jgi:hypothetical protein